MALISEELQKREQENTDQLMKIRDLQDEKFKLEDLAR